MYISIYTILGFVLYYIAIKWNETTLYWSATSKLARNKSLPIRQMHGSYG
jgi:hypothetical protein